MRPQGEVRQAISQAARALAAERAAQPVLSLCGQPVAGGTWREFATKACVGYAAARRTVVNMTCAGDLQAVGSIRVPGSRRPMALYAPAAAAIETASIDSIMRDWSAA